MDNNIIRLTESELRQIITESVSNVLNEIGDTFQGKLGIANAIKKAKVQGRNKQAEKFSNYLFNDAKLPKEILNIGENIIKYRSLSGDIVTVKGTKISNDGGRSWSSLEYMGEFNLPKRIKTTPQIARMIVKTLSPNVSDSVKDWHAWASL